MTSTGAGPFARATAVSATGHDTYRGEIADGWDIAGNANGGYLLAIAARALGAAAGRPDPVTVTGHYLAPGHPGPVTVETVVVKSGRRFTTATGTLRDADRPLLAVVGTFGELVGDDGPERIEGAPPDLPPVEQCLSTSGEGAFPPRFTSQIELRLHPEDGRFLEGAPSGAARMRGWFRLRDGEPIDTIALLCAVDAFPPTAFNAKLPVAWTPTVELTAHVRARPAPGWLACAFSTRFVTGGFLEADGEVWDGAGRLVAQSRQLALIPRG